MMIMMLLPRVVPSPNRGPFVGGGVVNLLNLSKGLHTLGHHVTIVAGAPPQAANQLRTMGLPYASFVPLAMNRRATSTAYGIEYLLKSLIASARWRKENRFDLVHGHSSYPPYALGTALAGRVLGVPTVHQIYCPVSERLDGEQRKLVLNSSISLRALDTVHRITAVSYNVLLSLKNLGVRPDKIVQVPMAVDVNVFSLAPPGSPHEPTVLFVGSLVRKKGIDVLLDAMAQVLAQLPQARLVATLELEHRGFDERLMEIEGRISELNIRSQVTRLGIVDDMPALMTSASVVVVPFLSTVGVTDYPMVALEAMAAGKPVVATLVGGIPEIVHHEETGLLVEPGDSDQLAEALLRILGNPRWGYELGRRGAAIVQNHFDLRHAAAATTAVYETLLKQTG